MAEHVVKRVLSTATNIASKSPKRLLTHDTSASSSVSASLNDIPLTKTMDDLPGPKGYPLIGTASEYFRGENKGQMHKVQRRFHDKYGPIFREKLGPVTNISVADPDLVEEIVRSEGKFPNRPPYASWTMYKKIRKQANGLMTAVNAEEWKKCRTAISRHMLRPKTALSYVDVMNEVSSDFIDRLEHIRDNQTKTIPNLQNELSKWAIESISTVLLESRLGCLTEHVSEENQAFINAVADMFRTGHQLMVFCDIHKKLNSKVWKTHVEAWDTIYRVGGKHIDRKMAELRAKYDCQQDSAKVGESASFLEHLMGNENIPLESIYANTTELLLSGLDTTSNAMAIISHLLSKNPRVQKKLISEVDSVLQNKTCTADDLTHLTYTKAIVREALRLFPVIPINARVLTDDTVIGGYLIPKGTCILLNTFTMSRDAKYFENPDEFIPERWERGTNTWNPFSNLPFGFGARSCVGRRLAQQELYLTMIKFAQRYWLEPTQDVEPTLRTVLTFNELPIKFQDR